jgi:hypothetical protein
MSNKISIEIDLEESYEDTIMEHIDYQVRNHMKSELKTTIANHMNPMISDAVKAAIMDKLDSFLAEEIVITDHYGKATFIGSIDDLLKKEFDDKLLHPVDSNGKRLLGCTTQSTTYIQWLLEKEMNKGIEYQIECVQRSLNNRIAQEVKNQLNSYVDEVINQKVSSSFMSLLKKSTEY